MQLLTHFNAFIYVCFTVAPYLYLVDNAVVTTIEGYSSTFGCYLLVGDTSKINWTWYLNGSAATTTLSQNSRVTWTNGSNNSLISISNTVITDTGTYTCSVTNSYGSHSRSVTLRIKSTLFF
jgi:hypothetical protein